MTTQVQAICVVCGGIADDVHHGRPHDLSQGKGAGGTKHDDAAHFAYLPLCRKDHDACHAKAIVLTRHGDLIRSVTADGELLGERALAFDDERYIPEAQDADRFSKSRNFLPLISDEGLAYLWQEATRFASQGYLWQCIIADAFRQRYGGRGDRWYERVAEILETSPQTVYERYRSWQYLQNVEHPEDELERQGKQVVAALGSRAMKGDDPQALADEIAAKLEEGLTRTSAAKALRDGTEHRPLPCAEGPHRCRWCGEEIE